MIHVLAICIQCLYVWKTLIWWTSCTGTFKRFFLCNINRYEGLQLIFFITTAGKDKQWKSTAWEGGPWSDDAVSGKKGQCTGILVIKTTSNKCLIVIPWEKKPIIIAQVKWNFSLIWYTYSATKHMTEKSYSCTGLQLSM